MAGGKPPSFNAFTCPDCQALYDLVKVEAGPETTLQEVKCLSCGEPLPARDGGEFVLKYFLLRKRLAFKGGAPIESPSQLPLLTGASRWPRLMRGSPLSRASRPIFQLYD
jgi:predicted Zn finger-like uncharacterized protein